MYICKDCHFHLPSINALWCHLRINHSYNVYSVYKCAQNGCSREYNSVKSFKKHLKDKHSAHMFGEVPLQAFHQEHLAELNENEELNLNIRNAVEPIDYGDENEQIGDMHNVAITALDFKKVIFESSRALVATLYASSTLNRAHVQEIIELISEFFSNKFITMLRSKTLSMLRAVEQELRQDNLQHLIEMFNTLENILQGFETETQRINALKASESYICPRTYRIGVSEKTVKIGNFAVLKPIELTGQHIPMTCVLKNFLELPGVFDAIFVNVENLNNSDKFTNIIQSPLWKNIKDSYFRDRLVLPLFIYFDDVEPDNHTGSHAGDHSLGALYYQIPCIPQHHMSTLENVFVSSIFLSDDRYLNNGNAFRPVINELKDLQDNGILVHTANGNQRVHFCLCLLLADNLGFHSITGFTESFNANYYCRFCKEHKLVMRTQVRENVLLLRNRENYEADIFINDVSLTGIKDRCVWNGLPTYHVVTNLVADLMHDILEGVCHSDFCALLEEMIFVKKYFTLETLNDRIQNFDYSFDIGDKPSVIMFDNIRGQKLKMSASEMLFFVRHFGLMIGDLVPEVEEVWQLYIRLVQILDIITAPFTDKNLATYLATLIAEHHELYCKLFSKTLKPKYHIMIHYPRIMNLIGPLIHVWSMRMEGKHRPVIKQEAKATTCKNLSLTVAKKYLLSLSARFLSKRGLQRDVIFHSKQKILIDCYNYNDFQHILSPGSENSVVVKEATICNITYKRNMVLAINFQNDLPLFGLLHWIVKPQLINDRVSFILSGFNTVGFNSHLHCYEVTPTVEWFCQEYKDLISFHPTSCRTGADGNSYVTFKHVL